MAGLPTVEKPIPLTDLGVIYVCGADAMSFLQRQFCGDLRQLAPGTALYTGWCNLQGRVIADLLVLSPHIQSDVGTNPGNEFQDQSEQADRYFLVLHHTQIPALVSGLQRFIFRDKVKITAAEELAVMGLPAQVVYHEHAKLPAIDDHAAHCAGSWYLPWDSQRKIILTVTTEVTALAADADSGRQATATRSTDYERWRKADIEAGVAWLPHSLSAQFLPQMLAFESLGAVSFAKGCYPGQEVIARTHYLGQVKRHWTLLHMSAQQPEPEVGAIIYNHKDEDVGVLLAIAMHGEDSLVLAVIRRETERHALHLQFGPHSTPLYNGESATCLTDSC